ncbi:hypothetical protein CEUSTIGMA_g3451.t1 [Chlamydomonas eustigma]|uniref:2Fe-2S ferredoxin-type domain-containing protein n=1 Tax=Chlamydomonas eustigma TaxID=1157962 RepID=A0A250WYU2_9CHLO|nr:hypothetical protein CEUSTIGMA_g3451.t1 [Chlamydomonas eustigma]|eukprot:GAX76008.1 hypothetical protein CEUSTIGMA_g3451.t1 [Chlamydomonas eustigma]
MSSPGFHVVVNYKAFEVPSHIGNLSLSEWLRSHAKIKSTKVGCGEGGCGACAVLISSHDSSTDRKSWRSVNSCLLPVFAAHNREVITAEKVPEVIADRFAAHHASQCGFCTPGMAVACHATLLKCHEKGQPLTEEVMRDAMDGNLCRCTGYRPIIDAYKSFAHEAIDMEDLGRGSVSAAPVAMTRHVASPHNTNASPHASPDEPVDKQVGWEVWNILKFDPTSLSGLLCCPPESWSASDKKHPASEDYCGPLGCYQLGADQKLLVPQSLHQLLETLCNAAGSYDAADVRLIAGNTGPGVYKDWPQQQKLLISLGQVPELLGVRVSSDDAGCLRVGAMVTLSQLADALLNKTATMSSRSYCRPEGQGVSALGNNGSDVDRKRLTKDSPSLGVLGPSPESECSSGAHSDALCQWRGMTAHIQRIAGHHVRNSATVGGNVSLCLTRSLPSDLATLLLAAGASVLYTDCTSGSAKHHEVSLEQYLGLHLQQNVNSSTTPAECPPLSGWASVITAVSIPEREQDKSDDHSQCLFWSSRIAKRHSNAVSLLNMAVKVLVNDGVVTRARIAVGMDLCGPRETQAWCLIRARQAEAVLQGLPLRTSATVSNAIPATKGRQSIAQALMALQADLKPVLEGSVRAEYLGAAAEGLLLQALTAVHEGSGPASSTQPAVPSRAVPSTWHLAPNCCSDDDTEDLKHCHEVLMESTSFSSELSSDSILSEGKSSDQEAAKAHAGSCQRLGKEGSTGPCMSDNSQTKMWQPTPEAAYPLPKPAVPVGSQSFPQPDPIMAPLTQPLMKTGAKLQILGTAVYTDDTPVLPGALFAAYVTSKRARAKVVSLDFSQALRSPGVMHFVGPRDIPGDNIGTWVSTEKAGTGLNVEPLFADTEVFYHGQPLGLILGTSYQAALRGASLVEVLYEEAEEKPLLTIQEALQAGSFYHLPDFLPNLAVGPTGQGHSVMWSTPGVDVTAALEAAPEVDMSAKYYVPSQVHMYMEPQTAVAHLEEDGCVQVVSACQGPDAVQWGVAAALKLPHNQVHAKVRRLGGAFGGKASHCQKVAIAAAVACKKAGEQVRFAVNRNTDFALCGGRLDTEVEYSVGYDGSGLLHALDMRVLLKGGAYPDVSMFEVMAMQDCGTAVYRIPAFRIEWVQVKCNVMPRTQVRGPGDLQAHLMIENVMEHVAAMTGLRAEVVRERNMLKALEGDEIEMGLGKHIRRDLYTLPRIWQELKEAVQYDSRVAEVAAYNIASHWRKRGISLVSCKYNMMTSARSALVSVYRDGSIMVMQPGVEMGQGLITKVLQTASFELSQVIPEAQRPLPLEFFRTSDCSTAVLPHIGIAGGSTTSEQACEAVRLACQKLVKRLLPLTTSLGPSYCWKDLITSVFHQPSEGSLSFVGDVPGVALTAHATGALKNLDGEEGYVYATFGAAVAMVEVDLLTGDRQVLSVDLLFDAGKTINPAVDIGQVEGAFMFGMGLMLSESAKNDPEDGSITTGSTWSYKIPGVYCIPQSLNVSLLKDSPLHVKGPISSKGVGEPPMLLSSAVLFALQDAASAGKLVGHKYALDLSREGTEMGRSNECRSICGSEGQKKYVPLCAPASPEHLKAFIGYQSVTK